MLRTRWHKALIDLWKNRGRTLIVALAIAVGVYSIGTVLNVREVLIREYGRDQDGALMASAILRTAPFDEDLAERIALRHLLPPTGRRLLDIGPGFGRLAEFYQGYEQVILLDYSRSLLRQAQERLGRDGRLVYVAASFYTMPLAKQVVDTAMMVRVMHHVEDVPTLLNEVARVLVDGDLAVLEYKGRALLDLHPGAVP